MTAIERDWDALSKTCQENEVLRAERDAWKVRAEESERMVGQLMKDEEVWKSNETLAMRRVRELEDRVRDQSGLVREALRVLGEMSAALAKQPKPES